MKVTELKSEGLSKSYKIIIPSNTINEAIKARLTEVAATAKIDGFRPGKIPMSIVKNRFGSQVSGEIVEKQVSDSMRKLFTDKKIKPAMQPKVDFEGKPLDGTDVKFTVNIEIMPEIKVEDFSKMKFERLVADVEEKDVSKALEDIASNQKAYSPLKKKRKSKIGDSVLIDFKGFLEGKLFEGGSAENHKLELGSGQMIPGFEDQLVGLNVNDKKNVEVNFPENYQKAELSGKPAKFEVIIKDILEAEKAKINDELASRMGLPDLKALKEAIKSQIEINYKNTSRNRIKRDLLDKLSKQYSFEIPKSMLENENKVIWDRFLEDKKAGVIDAADKGKKDSVLKKEYSEIAERRVRLGLLLAEIGDENKITVTDDEIKNAVMQEARKYPGEENKVIEFYQKNPEAANAVRAPIFEEKVVDHIISKCTIKDIKVSVDKLFEDNVIPDPTTKTSGKAKVKKTTTKKSSTKSTKVKNNK
ncbi:MAG: trigger factor [Pelagibacterales bacterium]|nr:trigger factor [Pelagibacterales bacterium]